MSDIVTQLRTNGWDKVSPDRVADEITRLRAGIFEIMAACRDGKVCDDVAWFNDRQTLWDHCVWLVDWNEDLDAPLPTDPPTAADLEYVAQRPAPGTEG